MNTRAVHRSSFVRHFASQTIIHLNSPVSGLMTIASPLSCQAGNTVTVASVTTTDLPTTTTGGVHAGVIFYCAPPGATSPSDLILSWK